ncbi:hypothetical protein Taro_001296, partial [Colocasia esculenta]|nr:hypothetical protein [Colocasia esculenta]
MENIIRLQRELEEARSSLGQEVKDDAKDSEEEAAFVRDDEEYRRSISSKTKEVERLKRKKPSWLRIGLNLPWWFVACSEFGFDFADLCGFLTTLTFRFGIAYLYGLLAIVLELGLNM